MELRRRDLLKVLGLAAAGSVLPGCERETHNLVPLLLPDEEIVPGVDNWYASTCQECEAGCGILVRVREGRAKKLEGNPSHPLNQGKLCALGQAGLQGLYNPDRIRGPLKRVGRRDEARFEPIGWEEGLALWVRRLRAHPGASALVSRPVSGTLADLFALFMAAVSGKALLYDSQDAVAVRRAVEGSFGVSHLPQYDLAGCDYLVSFGAPFLEHWLSPVAFGVGYGKMRQGRPGLRGRFVQVEPRLSLTAANADRWIPIRPGTEGLLAMGIGRVILDEGRSPLSASEREPFERIYRRYALEEIAAETEVPVGRIHELARELAAASAPLALGGGFASAQTNGTATLMAINGLNGLVGNLGKPGGLRFFAPPRFPRDGPDIPLVGAQALVELVEEFRHGTRRVLHLYGTNPLFTLPPSTGIRELFERAAFIVSFSSFLDESTAMADLVLPDHSPLESWGDHPHVGLVDRPVVGVSQPVVRPLYDTRPVGDQFLLAAGRLGGAVSARLPWDTWYSMLRARWGRFLEQTAGDGRGDEAAWVQRLQEGGWWEESGRPVLVHEVRPPPSHEPASFEGDPQEYPFYFYPFSSVALDEGRGANRPWLQELPDPLTTVVWGSWVEINPEMARTHGFREGELVRVVSPFGEVEAPVVFFPGMRPDLVGMPVGQGHTAYGRYARGRGANALSIVGPAVDPRSGGLATGGTRVRIEPSGRKGRLVRTGYTRTSALISIDRRQEGV